MMNSLRKVQLEMGLPAGSILIILRFGTFYSLAICNNDIMYVSLNSKILSFLNW